MAEETPKGPQYIATKQIPRVEVPQNTLDAVLTEMRAMRVEQRASTQELTDKVDALTITVDTLQHDAKDTRLRLGRMERELDEVKDRQTNASVRVKGESEVNLKQDAAIAMVITKVDRLEQKTDAQTAILEKLADGAKQVASNPKVQLLAGILWTALLGYLASKGLVTK